MFFRKVNKQQMLLLTVHNLQILQFLSDLTFMQVRLLIKQFETSTVVNYVSKMALKQSAVVKAVVKEVMKAKIK